MVESAVGNAALQNTYNCEGLSGEKEVNNKSSNYVYIYDKIVLELDEYGNEIARILLGHNLISRTMTNSSGIKEEYSYLYNGHSAVTTADDNSGSSSYRTKHLKKWSRGSE